jgi:hypothetical protein
MSSQDPSTQASSREGSGKSIDGALAGAVGATYPHPAPQRASGASRHMEATVNEYIARPEDHISFYYTPVIKTVQKCFKLKNKFNERETKRPWIFHASHLGWAPQG